RPSQHPGDCRGASKGHNVRFILVAAGPQPACRVRDVLGIAPSRLCAGEARHDGFMRNTAPPRRRIGFCSIPLGLLFWIARIEFDEAFLEFPLARSAYYCFFVTLFFFASIARPLRVRLCVRLRVLRDLRVVVTLVVANCYDGLTCVRLRVDLPVHFETIQKRSNALVGTPAPGLRQVTQAVRELAALEIDSGVNAVAVDYSNAPRFPRGLEQKPNPSLEIGIRLASADLRMIQDTTHQRDEAALISVCRHVRHAATKSASRSV